MRKNILPVGSIVTLNIMKNDNQEAKFIIQRRFVINPNNKNEYFEYELMLYPGGTKDGKLILINNEQISNVIFEGYSDELDVKFIKATYELLDRNELNKVKIEVKK